MEKHELCLAGPAGEELFCGPIANGSDRADYEIARHYLARQFDSLKVGAEIARFGWLFNERLYLDRNDVAVQVGVRYFYLVLFHDLRDKLLDLPIGYPSLEKPGLSENKTVISFAQRDCGCVFEPFDRDDSLRAQVSALLARYRVPAISIYSALAARFGDIVAYPILGGLHHRYVRI
jgi:hypothetical protein